MKKEIDFKVISNKNPISLSRKEQVLDLLTSLNCKINDDSKNIIVIGGDGTFLKTFSTYKDIECKMCLLSTGRVGYYQMHDCTNDISKLMELFTNSNKFSSMNVISYSTNNFKEQCLNELIISCNKTINFDIYINNIKYEHFMGSGICFSTSTGSTAHSKNYNGAILFPTDQIWQLVEICPISSYNYKTFTNTLILNKDMVVEIRNISCNDELFLIVDGRTFNFDSKKIGDIKINLEISKPKILFDKDLKFFINKMNEIFIKGKKND